jgi:hypothetical protein
LQSSVRQQSSEEGRADEDMKTEMEVWDQEKLFIDDTLSPPWPGIDSANPDQSDN